MTQPAPNPQRVARDQAVHLLHLRQDSPEVAAIRVLLRGLSQEARDELIKTIDVPSIYRLQGAARSYDQILKWIEQAPIKIPVQTQQE